jgi:tyrosyl-DNA phosphodiesterase 1
MPSQNPSCIQWMVLINFKINMPFVIHQVPELLSIPKVFIMAHRVPEQQNTNIPHGEQDVEAFVRGKPNFSVFYPYIGDDFGTHHSKAFIIAYGTRLRVCIHTANYVDVDWEVLTNAAWMQDFPLKTAGSAETSPFEEELFKYIKTTQWPGGDVPNLGRVTKETLRLYDFSQARVALVASRPGKFNFGQGNNSKNWGHAQVADVLSKVEFDPVHCGSPQAWQFSSLSSIYPTNATDPNIKRKWMHELDSSFSAGRVRGQPGMLLGPSKDSKFIWPTRQEMEQSICPTVGGSIPSSKVNADKTDIFRERRCRWAAADGTQHPEDRRHVLPHMKSFLRHSGQSICWLYLGSSNLSMAAWGTMQGAGANRCLYVKSYELGVLFLPSLLPKADDGLPLRMITTVAPEAAAGGNVAGVTPCGRYLALPLPYPLPPVPYTASETPWYSRQQ